MGTDSPERPKVKWECYRLLATLKLETPAKAIFEIATPTDLDARLMWSNTPRR